MSLLHPSEEGVKEWVEVGAEAFQCVFVSIMLYGVDTEGSLGFAGSQPSSRFSEKTEKSKEDARCGGKCL